MQLYVECVVFKPKDRYGAEVFCIIFYPLYRISCRFYIQKTRDYLESSLITLINVACYFFPKRFCTSSSFADLNTHL